MNLRCLKHFLLIFPKMALLALFSFLMSTTSSSFCQEKFGTGAVRGVVRGMMINEGRIIYTRIPNAKVSLAFTDFSTYTGSDGRFEIKNIAPGKYEMVIEADGFGKETRTVNIRGGKILNVRSVAFLVGVGQKPPLIIPGSPVAAFSTISQIDEKRNGTRFTAEDLDTPTNSIIFYTPNEFKAYLEVVISDRPIRVAYGKDRRTLFIAYDTNKVEMWDLGLLEIQKTFPFPGTITNMEWNSGKTKLYVSFSDLQKSGIAVINVEEMRIEQVITPPHLGAIGDVFPLEEKNLVFAVISRLKDGRLVKLELGQDRKYLITKKQTVGDLPIALVYLPHFNNLMVVNNKSRNILTVEEETFKPKFLQVTDGEPCRIISNEDSTKVYVSIVDKGEILVINGKTGGMMKSVKVGKKPFSMCLKDNLLFVANYEDRTISIIDCKKDQVIFTTEKEDFQCLRDVDV